jgi:hypothetical protein
VLKNFMSLSDRAEIAHDVLSYLAKNDEAGDTFEGIVEWWLLERNIRRGSSEVKAALDDLVARGLIREYKTRDAKVHYRTNSRKQKEINALIEKQ